MHLRRHVRGAARLLALVALGLCALLGAGPAAGQTAGSLLYLPFVSNIDGIGRIAWVSNRDSSTNIWTMRGDGSNQVGLAIEGVEYNPSWAPDGERLVFALTLDYATYNLYEVNIEVNIHNTSVVTPLTNLNGRNDEPAWSPDGSQIAFTRRSSGTSFIWLMDANGGNPHQLTDGYDSQPSWSPDGSKIVFTRSIAGSTDIYQVARTGGEATYLVATGAQESHPVYAPDGSTLAYLSNAPDGINHIWLRNAQGVTSRLTTNMAPIESLAWSPGSEYIVYSMETPKDSPYLNLYKVSVRTGSVTQLTSGNYRDQEPDWYP